MAFHPYPQVIAAVFNRRAFGPPRGLTPASACPGIAHPASRLRPATQLARFGLAFAAARLSSLTSPPSSNSLAHSTKGTPSHHTVLRRLAGARFQVLFHSPPGVLFTFPSRYWCAIGHMGVFRLGGWSPRVRTGFHVPGPTQVPRTSLAIGSAYGALTRCGRPSHAVPLPVASGRPRRQTWESRPCNPCGAKAGARMRSQVWPRPPFARRYSGDLAVDFLSSGYLDVSVPRVVLPLRMSSGGGCTDCSVRVRPFGDPRVEGCVPLTADYRSLPRPSSAPCAKASAVRP